MSGRHRYQGHRAQSYFVADEDLLTELRASQRTFNGAYMRTALGNMGFSLTVLRLFGRLFYRIGIVYAVLAFLLCVCTFFRARYARHDIADTHDPDDDTLSLLAIPTVGQEHKKSFGRPFVTAGKIVAVVAFVVAGTEIALFVLILQL
ncbi:hypothetical protein BGW80DRAFT_761227 [Lactifluus volemus]|nr:hypothetical protein BGW80DRAFT_761227 [Lactifluus volemus]